MPDIACVNGRFMPLAGATVSVEDRGYQFGDGVYEVVRTYAGVPFQLDAHLARLDRSAKAVGISLPLGIPEWERTIIEGIRLAGYPECKVYIQVTRGVAPREHGVPIGVEPTVVMTVREIGGVDERLRLNGVDVITLEDARWGRCDIKSLNLLPNVLARQQAKEADAFEAVLVWNGEVTEGAVSNVMAVRAGAVCTPPLGTRILDGVTRRVVLDLARREGIPIQERHLPLDELRAADEVLLTGTTVEVLAVVRVDGALIGAGSPGPVTKLLEDRFRGLVGRSGH